MFQVNERTSALYTATLTDATGAVVAASALTSLKLTYFDARSGAIINGRNDQDVLNANDVTLSEAGALVWALSPTDTAVVDTNRGDEIKVAIFRAIWASGAKGVTHRVDIRVVNMPRIT